MKVILVGAGRMGLRHLEGLRRAGADVVAVDPRPESRRSAESAGAKTAADLDGALRDGGYDAAVLSETADGRLERFSVLAQAGVRSILLEKPLEQSRARMRSFAQTARAHGVDARVNHWFRTAPLFRELHVYGGPYDIEVTGGAWGLACNGIHWLDLGVFLAGPGRLLWGEVEETPIVSGRGGRFRDYGGRGIFGFADGSRLAISSRATSSAPMHAVVVQRDRETVVLPHEERALVAERDRSSELPAFRYGADYARREVAALEADELSRTTERWAQAITAGSPLGLPTLAESAAAHELLFDLLEVTGDDRFPVT